MNSRLAQEILSLKNLALRPHDTCEDWWYSCPKSGQPCRDDIGDECLCGADAHNAEVEARYAEIVRLL